MIPNDSDNCQASNENELDELLRAAKVYTDQQADDAQTDAQTDQVDGAQEPTRTYSDYRSIVDWFKLSGIALRRNLMTDDLHLGNEPINDYDLKEIRSKARDAGIKIHPLEDAIGRYAKANAYHPIRDYFDGLTWDGADHIGALAACIATPHPAIVYKDGTQQSAARAALCCVPSL